MLGLSKANRLTSRRCKHSLRSFGGEPTLVPFSALRDPRFRVPRRYWENVEHRRNFFDNFALEFGLNTANSWYTVSMKDIFAYGGRGLMRRFKYSISTALSDVYPEIYWCRWKFTKVPNRFWADEENQRRYLYWVECEMEMKDLDGWYDITLETMYELGGAALLQQYHNHSLFQCLSAIYPEHAWQEFRFKKLPRGVILRAGMLDDFVDYATKSLHIKSLDDWYRVSKKQIAALGGDHIIQRNGGLAKVLRTLYPLHQWDPARLGNAHSKKATQRWLFLQLSKILPWSVEAFEESMMEGGKEAHGKRRGRGLRFDIFIPSLSLAFEYQGSQHYCDHIMFGEQSTYEVRDDKKRRKCKELGINMVEVPYWWDGSEESLYQIIQTQQPKVMERIQSLKE